MPDADHKSEKGTKGEYDAQLNVPVPSEWKDRFRVEAARKGIPMSELARRKLMGDAHPVPA